MRLEEYYASHLPFYERVLNVQGMTLGQFKKKVQETTAIDMIDPLDDTLHLDWLTPFTTLKTLGIVYHGTRSISLRAEGLEKTAVETFSITGGYNIRITEISATFGTSCRKIHRLSIDCAFSIPLAKTVRTQLSFPALHTLRLGAQHAPTARFSSIWCMGITSLESLSLWNMPATMPLHLIAPNLSSLSMTRIPLTFIPIGWRNLHRLTYLYLLQTQLHAFPTEGLATLEALEYLYIGNDPAPASYETGNDFRQNPGVVIDTRFQHLKKININNVPMHRVFFGSVNNQSFHTLQSIELRNRSVDANGIYNRIRFSVDTSNFDALREITLIDRQAGAEDSGYFPPEVVSFPALRKLVVGKVNSPATFNPESPFTDYLMADATHVRTNRLWEMRGGNQNPFTNQLIQTIVDAMGVDIPEEVTRPLPTPNPVRAEPYFIKWNVTKQCSTAEMLTSGLDPFNGTEKCIVCREEFNAMDRAHHDAEPEIINNDFFNRKPELQADAEAVENRMGCVVVCNMTPSDIKAYTRNMELSKEKIHAVMCGHWRHFAHRVCYSIHLIHQRENGNTYNCPASRVTFLN